MSLIPGLYAVDLVAQTAYKLIGDGPKTIKPIDVGGYFKYDSGAKTYSRVCVINFKPTIDAIVLMPNAKLARSRDKTTAE